MNHSDNTTRKARIAMEGNIPGSLGWTLMKNDGIFPPRTVTRNSIKFAPERSVRKGPNYNEEAISNGWVFHPQTLTWTHSSYSGKSFPSIYQTLSADSLWETKVALPYHNNEDEFGLAYGYTISCSGQNMNICPNKWESEEFDTRRGRRRELWRYKKEMRKKYALQFQAYKEQQREKEEEQYDEYEREFTIQK
tara:strand:- start:748 stop:1326 length:579 start_codon:yes stop_codon:yes gene_type:complete